MFKSSDASGDVICVIVFSCIHVHINIIYPLYFDNINYTLDVAKVPIFPNCCRSANSDHLWVSAIFACAEVIFSKNSDAKMCVTKLYSLEQNLITIAYEFPSYKKCPTIIFQLLTNYPKWLINGFQFYPAKKTRSIMKK